MKSAKAKIHKAVADYMKLYPQEYVAIAEVLKAKRDLSHDEFARLAGSSDSRGLFEVPEKLNWMMMGVLSDEEKNWFSSGIPTNPNQGGRWFAKSFPVFSLAEKV